MERKATLAIHKIPCVAKAKFVSLLTPP